ncbi:DUF4998 domain-containing protein [Parapedobacter sp. DT-150]|uniref:DUF4998 domain-containing protein n=1 Tax=Parapedobacter sp. DT-150 TaxID=3396162 RepID=UPI003F19EA3A
MMNVKKHIGCGLAIACLAGMLVSCEKQNSSYADFLEDGEKIYSGRPDSLQTFAGNGRIKVSWDLVSDPKITKCRVFWNNRADSVEVPIADLNGRKQFEAVIDGLSEGTYTFEVFSYDDRGNTSIRAEVIGNVYGPTFAETLLNRPLDSATYTPETGNLGIAWFGANTQVAVVEIISTDVDGEEIETIIYQVPNPINPSRPPIWAGSDTIANYKEGTSFKYRTGYVPEVTAIDTFYTDYTVISADDITIPPLPPPAVVIKEGSLLIKTKELYLVDGVNREHLIMEPGIRVADLQHEVVSGNAYTFASSVYQPDDLAVPRSDDALIRDGDIIVFYYPDDEENKVEVTASVYSAFKFASRSEAGVNSLNANVSFSASSGASVSNDVAYTGSPQFAYLQTANNASAAGEWVAITSNVPVAGNYKVDVVSKTGTRGNADIYLGSIAPSNKIGETLITGAASNPPYLANLIVDDDPTAGHKFAINTIDMINLTQGDNQFFFSILANGSAHQIVLESIQLRLVD